MQYFIHLRLFGLLMVLVSALSANPDVIDIKQLVPQAYNFDAQTFETFDSLAEKELDPLIPFVTASASYWIYQSDRINEGKRAHAIYMLDQAVDKAKAAWKKDKKNLRLRFYLGIGYCNRARYYTEEQKWVKSYLDAREGMGILRDVIEEDSEFHDAKFALGVAECFLSDAPFVLKPLARLLGFKGSAEDGIEKLETCRRFGEWTSIEAEYYLGYYYYSVVRDGKNAVSIFAGLAERFPRNPLFGYFLGRSYQINHQPLDALQAYRDIRDVCYEQGADDIGNWATYRIGNILHGEHFCEEAIQEYNRLKPRLDEFTHRQEYFYRLPLKFAKSYIELGNRDMALVYLKVIESNWDGETYKRAKKLIKELEE